MKCVSKFDQQGIHISLVEFLDDGRYEFTCPRGHETVTILQEQKFEILFDIGANAILDGYYREAISSFTSSLERFYAFVISVLLESSSSTEDQFKDCWSKVSRQSERQLGAFIFLWASQLNKAPDILSTDMTKLRNDVIHNGKIPTKEHAIEFGNAILELIRPKMLLIKDKFPDAIQEVIFRHLRDCRLEKDLKINVGTMSMGTLVNLASADNDHQNKTFLELIDWLDESRHKINRYGETGLLT